MTFHSLLVTPAAAEDKQEVRVPACPYGCSGLERKSGQKLLTAVLDEDQEEVEANDYNLLKSEISAMRSELNKISLGQSELKSVVSKIHDHLIALPEENDKPADFAERVVAPAAVDNDGSDNNGSQSFAMLLSTLSPSTLAEPEQTPTGMLRNRAQARKEISKEIMESMIDCNTEVQSKKLMEAEQARRATCLGRLLMLGKKHTDMLMDAARTIIIISNSIFLGLCSDHWDGSKNSIFFAFDVMFVVIFGIEFVSRLYMYGVAGSYCGSSGISNMMDTFLVAVDTIQLLLLVFSTKTTEQLQAMGVPSASLFRTLRLVRVTRVLRLLRHPFFSDMLKMIEGTVTGAKTLGGAFIMFTVMVYCMALLCTEVFGRDTSSADVYLYFCNVPRSVYTLLRCSFGDCTTSGGTPIPEFLKESYGFGGSVLYSLFIFFMTVGFFNVVSAAFVDGIMSHALDEHKAHLHMRLADEQLLATNVCHLVRLFLEDAGCVLDDWDDQQMKDCLHSLELPRYVISNVCQTKEAKQILAALDIDPDDHGRVADILDADHNGTVSLCELMNGLRSLRGHPRRSDVVMIDLMVQGLQRSVDDMISLLTQNGADRTRKREKDRMKEKRASRDKMLKTSILK